MTGGAVAFAIRRNYFFLATSETLLRSALHNVAVASSREGLSVGRPVFVRFARVGLLNEVGDLLDPTVVILLVGERPGMATAESLSAYMAYRPRSGHTDAQRNLISNIHSWR